MSAELAPGPERYLPGPGDAGVWQDRGACRGADPALFFVDAFESTAEARAICAACEVQPVCLEHAVTAVERHGIWGGLDELERRRIRTARSSAARQ